MSSASSSSSSSPEPDVIPNRKQRKEKRQTVKKSSKLQGKNEGTNPHWKYEPPADAILVDHGVDNGIFDWDAVNDDDNVELWLIRIPEGVKPKYLESIRVDQPPPSSSSKSQRVGLMERKYATYDIWSIGSEDKDESPIGGEEVTGLSCLLPRKQKNGKLYQAPKPIARHLVVSAQAVVPAPPVTTPSDGHLYKNVPRQVYPQERLKHRYLPYGSQWLPPEGETDVIDVDAQAEVRNENDSSQKLIVSPEKAVRKKKRKGDGDPSEVKTKKLKKAR